MRKTILCSLLLLLAYLPSGAQISLTAGANSIESFNGMATGTSLPANWKVSAAGTVADWNSAGNTTTLAQVASSGTPATAGSYNWGTTAGTDRAVGFLTNGSYAAPNTILAHYQNNTGSTITELAVSFQVERYHTNTSPFFLQFFTSGDGTFWTVQTGGSLSAAVYPVGASAYDFTTPRTVYKTVVLSGLNIASGSALYLRWVFGSAGTSGQGLGLDNVVVSVNTTSPVVTASLADALTTDVNGNSKANEGDKLTYTATLKSSGKEATGVQYTAPLDANTTLSGDVRSTPLAVDDNFSTALNTATGGNVKTNDFGLPAAAFTVVSFGATETPSATTAGAAGVSDNGGTVSVNADGSFTYTPPASFTGYDRFAYTLAAGVTPNDVGIVTIAVGSVPSATAESFGVLGNVSISPNAASGVLSNDGGTGIGIGAVNNNPAGVGAPITTTNGGTVTLQPDGSFTYNPAPGFTGASDNFSYTVDNGFSQPATVQATLNVSGLIWFINNTAGSGGDGRLSSPFSSLAGVSNGAGGSAANQTIFLYSGSGSYTGGITLLGGQKLIGQGATTDLATFAGVTVPAHSAPLPSTGGTAPVITNTAGNGVTLASGNTLRGFTIGNASGSALSGTSFGTLNVSELSINTTGQALSLNNGTANGTIASLTSSGGTNNVSLTTVGGTLAISAGSMSGASATAFSVSGGAVSLTYGGGITQAGSAAMVNISGGHTGTLTFQTGTLNASAGTGLQFDNADGTYNFNGTTTLSGGDAGIDIVNGSGGTFSFGTGTSITSPSGIAFNIDGTSSLVTAAVTFSGAITQANNAALLHVKNQGTGTMLFQTGTLSAGNGSGLQFDNADGTYSFNGTTTLNGGDAGIDILNGATGVFSFSANTTITSPSGTAFHSAASSPSVTYSGNITQNTAGQRVVSITDQGSGTITFQTGTLNASNGNGIVLTNVDGTINFDGVTTLAGGNAHLEVLAGTDGTNGSQGTITFSNTGVASKIENPSGGILVKVTGSKANLSYAGTLTRTGAAASHAIEVQTNKGGTITFSGATKSLTSTATAATGTTEVIYFNANAGNTTLAFTGGNLTINSNSNGGLVASNTAPANATLKVQGTNNVITSTTGTALSVTNTTIGIPISAEGGLNFRSISANGGTNGIVLNSTGSIGGLRVAGTGAVNSGGTIQLMTGSGVSLINTSFTSLSHMLITANNANGLYGDQLTNFLMTSCQVTNNDADPTV